MACLTSCAFAEFFDSLPYSLGDRESAWHLHYIDVRANDFEDFARRCDFPPSRFNVTVVQEFIGFGDKHQNATRITIWYVFKMSVIKSSHESRMLGCKGA